MNWSASRFSTLVATVLAGFAAASTAVAAIPFGHGRIVGTGSARLDYDSNIFVSSSEVSDLVGTVDGGVRYVRDASVFTTEAAAGFTAYAFADHDDQNSIDPYVMGKFGYLPSDKTDLRGNASYRRNTLANETLNDRTSSNDVVLDGSLQQLFSEKLGFRVTGAYGNSNYLSRGYSDVLNYEVGLNAVHVYSPKLTLLAGVTRAEWWTDNRAPGHRSPASKDWRYTVGFEGEIAPKVTGEVSIGLIDRQFNGAGFDDNSGLYLSNRVTWTSAEKNTVTLVLNRTLRVSAADQSLKSFYAMLTASQPITQKITIEESAGYTNDNYAAFARVGNRTDDGYSMRVRTNITIKENISADFSVGWRRNNSPLAFSDYSRLNIGAGIAMRF